MPEEISAEPPKARNSDDDIIITPQLPDHHESKKTTPGREGTVPPSHSPNLFHRRNKSQIRKVYLNGPEKNAEQKFSSNTVRTSKYQWWSFLPKNLFEQFRRLANAYFLVNAVLSCIPSISPTSPWTNLLPLLFVLSVTAITELYHDVKRHQADNKVNNSVCEMLRDGRFVNCKWSQLLVGDIVRVTQESHSIPADLVIVSTSDPDGFAYVETANLDGETNLKIRQAPPRLAALKTEQQLCGLQGMMTSEVPNNRLHSFDGAIHLPSNDDIPISLKETLLRGCDLRNTKWVVGIVVFTGHDTKIMRNSQFTPSKRSNVDKIINKLLFVILALQLTIVIIMTCLSAWWADTRSSHMWFLHDYNSTMLQRFLQFFTQWLAFSYLIPISLYVSIEIAKIIQGMFIALDVDMYHEETDTPAVPRTTNLNEELGQVAYVFSDKTGTLTSNQMLFAQCCIAGTTYGTSPQASRAARTSLCSPSPLPLSRFTVASISSTPLPHSASNNLTFATLPASAASTPIRSPTPSHPDLPIHRPSVSTRTSLSTAPHIQQPPSPLPTNVTAPKSSKSGLFRLLKGGRLSQAASDTATLGAAQATRRFYDATLDQVLHDRHSPDYLDALDFFTCLAVCHTVIPDGSPEDPKHMAYHGPSPDELALVSAARDVGFVFHSRTPTSVAVTIHGELQVFEILNVLEFNSDRKRMSVICRTPKGLLKLYCKGADSMMMSRIKPSPHSELLNEQLRDFSVQGLRTLVLASRDLDAESYNMWNTEFKIAATSILDRENKLAQVAELIEKGMHLLGATAIEDKLQDGVPDTIAILRKAGMRVWMLTGDKQETAINIARSCCLIDATETIIILNDLTKHGTRNQIAKGMSVRQSLDKAKEYAVVIDGTTLDLALDPDLSQEFLALCQPAGAVVCCRVTPLQKALVVRLVRKSAKGKVTLAIGDGANDVAMIQEAHVGIGISGKEGLQAVRSSDYAIAQFRFLQKLLLVHGHWSYHRVAALLLYSFYKNIIFNLPQLWFAIYSGFSGQILYGDAILSLHNALLTATPIVALASLDQIVSASSLLANPWLYKDGPANTALNVNVLSRWYLDGAAQSVLVFFLPMISMFSGAVSSQGLDAADYAQFGWTVYTALLMTLHLKIARITHYWTWINHLCLWLSIVVYWVVLILHSEVLESGFTYRALCTEAIFWLTVFVVMIICQLPDFVYNCVESMFFPTPVHIVREQQYLQRHSSPPSWLRRLVPFTTKHLKVSLHV